MSVSNIATANSYLAQSYKSAQSDMATALARLGSNKRFQSASDDSDGYIKVTNLKGAQGVYDASYASANTVKGEMVAFDGWATAMLDTLGKLKAAAGDTQKEAALVAAIADLNAARFNGSDITDGDTTTTMKGVDGVSTAINVAAVTVTGTVLSVDTDITNMTAFANAVEQTGTQADAISAAASAMSSTSRAAENTITEIDAAAEMAKYTAADIVQQSAVAVMAQGNTSSRSVLLLFR
jgi:flagellin-like hook-associated protein FlgL